MVQRKKDQAIGAAPNHCSRDSPQEWRCSGTSNAPKEPLLMCFLAELGSKNLKEVGRRHKGMGKRGSGDKLVLSIQLHLSQVLAISQALFSILVFSQAQGTIHFEKIVILNRRTSLLYSRHSCLNHLMSSCGSIILLSLLKVLAEVVIKVPHSVFLSVCF